MVFQKILNTVQLTFLLPWATLYADVGQRFQSMAKEQGVGKDEQSYLLAVIGIANTAGRIVLGYLSDKTWVNRLWVYNWCLTICGISEYNNKHVTVLVDSTSAKTFQCQVDYFLL